MAVLSRPRFLPQQRLDLEDVNALLAALRTDAKLNTKQFLSITNLIYKGFSVTGIGLKSATVNMADATLIIPQNSNDFSWFTAAPAEANIVIPDADLADGARNYVEISLTTANNTPLTKAFWDPEANSGAGQEFNQTVDTITDLQVNMIVTTGGFTGSPDRLPLCIIDVDGSGNIKTILDRRNLFGRLARPSNIDNRFSWGSLVEPPYSLNMTSVTGTFTLGETVNIGTETAIVTTGGTTNIAFNAPSGINFFPGDTVTGVSSGATGTINTVSEAFTGVDKNLKTQKDINDALMTEFAVVKGTRFWWQNPASSLAGIAKFLESILTQATATGAFSWDGTQLSITDDNVSPSNDTLGYIRMMGRSGNLSLTREDGTGGTSKISIADGQVMFVKIPATGSRAFSATGTGDTNYQLVTLANYQSSDENYWLAYREGTRLYIRGYGELEPGETVNIGDPELEDILAQIALNASAANQDRTLKLIEGGTWNYNVGGGGTSTVYNLATNNISNYLNSPTVLIGQKFLASVSGTLNQIRVNLSKTANPDTNIRINVYADNAGVPGALLGFSSNVVHTTAIPTAPTTTDFAFNFSGITLVSGTSYHFVVRSITQIVLDGVNRIAIQLDNGNPYASGDAVSSSNDGSSWTVNTGNDVRAAVDITQAATNSLSLSADAYIQVPGLLNARNTISAQTISFPNANSLAYVTINRTGSATSVRSVTVADADAVTLTADMVVVARRVSTGILVGAHSFLLKDKESLEIDGALAEINRRLGQLKLRKHPTTAAKAIIDSGDINQLDASVLSQIIGNFLLKFTGATINFNTGTILAADDSTALGTNFTPFSVPSNQYFWYGVSLIPGNVDTDNTQFATVQIDPADTASATQALAAKPLLTGEIKLGAIQVFNNAGVLEIAQVRRLGVGSGSGGGKTLKATYMDPVSTTLPTGSSVTIDGATGVNGDLVLFTNLSSNNNSIYKLGGVGSSITWTRQRSFSGQFTPTDGDTVRIQSGASLADQNAVFNGTNFHVNNIIRMFDGVSGNFWELSSIKRSTIVNNTTADIFSIAYLGSENMTIDYSILRGTAKETGQLFITTDGTNVAVTKATANINDAGIEFSAFISSGTLHVQYTSSNSGATGSIKYIVKRWSDASSGGPTGIPSYSGGGGGGGSAGGANTQIQYNNAGVLDGDSRNTWDGTLGALNLNGLRVGSLSSGVTLADAQGSPALAFQYALSFKFAIIEYSIERSTDIRVGRLLVPNNGTIVSLSDDNVDTGSTGIVFSATISGANVNINYTSTSTGNTATLKYSIRRWS